jgi:hypothetical protein
LRRNPDEIPNTNFDGWQFLLNKLSQFNGNFKQLKWLKHSCLDRVSVEVLRALPLKVQAAAYGDSELAWSPCERRKTIHRDGCLSIDKKKYFASIKGKTTQTHVKTETKIAKMEF